jgi:hypothetical protein
MECTVCRKPKELRMGVCFDCAEAESIIHEGLSMFDIGPNGCQTPAKTPMEKLIFLMQKGWRKT